MFAFLAEHRRALFPPEAFADMYAPVNGRPSVPPSLLATVVVLQALHGLSDEEAVAALRFDLRWKATCGLGLYDQGFDPSLLTYFRRRLARSPAPDRIFQAVRTVVEQTGVLAGRTRRALDLRVLLHDAQVVVGEARDHLPQGRPQRHVLGRHPLPQREGPGVRVQGAAGIPPGQRLAAARGQRLELQQVELLRLDP
ncbi:hypothetical protein H4W80_005443 [Nonomuraea angiospora]|uniref:Transposase InsH N-terminal domain-containing protein n=1 Tax=Nonomuraea angiospora TaxID=46172 RepID=A0ABR9M3K9_9ACTN|nr:transposase [Nonomuraea angiospora]MBE1587185.1 hypothetical protein [Nonomuraea angiospora]